MAYLRPEQHLNIIKPIPHSLQVNTCRATKRLNWLITAVIACTSTLTMSWGISMGELLSFLVRGSSLRYLGYLLGLGISVSVAIITSIAIQLITVLWLWLYNRYHKQTRSVIISPPPFTRQPFTTIYDYLNEANFQIWSIIWNIIRGLGLSLAFVLGSLIIVR